MALVFGNAYSQSNGYIYFLLFSKNNGIKQI